MLWLETRIRKGRDIKSDLRLEKSQKSEERPVENRMADQLSGKIEIRSVVGKSGGWYGRQVPESRTEVFCLFVF